MLKSYSKLDFTIYHCNHRSYYIYYIHIMVYNSVKACLLCIALVLTAVTVSAYDLQGICN